MNSFLSSLLGRRFYLMMSLLCAVVVAIGFAPRFDERMLHPAHAVPAALWLHTLVASLWVLLVIVQSALVQSGRVALHRRLGLASVAVAAALVGVSVWMAVISGHERMLHGVPDRPAFLAIPLSNMVTFAAFFAAAIVWRKRPEYHRRLILLAAMSLLVAALARFPAAIVPKGRFNIATDVLIGLALLRDLAVDRRIHRAYLVGLPALIAFQLLVEWLRQTPWWIDLATRILQ